MLDAERLEILTESAKYDVSCSSSGSKRVNENRGLGNGSVGGICHSFTPDGRCISLLKILMSNDCVYDCEYCPNRRSADVPRASITPDEICELVINFYKRNYIEGLFLSSAVFGSPDRTMELLCETVIKLRKLYNFNGYIHLKGIPHADEALVFKAARIVDRMSYNVELPSEKSLKLLAPQKTKQSLLLPMKGLRDAIVYDKENKVRRGRVLPAGQTTQMIIGASPETDGQILKLTQSLYRNMGLRRVYYSSYVPVVQSRKLPAVGAGLLREHRLYQADWLLRFYGFEAQELLSEGKPNFNVLLDPKADWALRHLEQFPVEINRASYQTILRVPGIGVKSARRIVRARRNGSLNFDDLKKIGVTLKRALYFITCSGKMMYPTKLDEDYIARNLVGEKERLPFDRDGMTYKQLSLFDDTGEFSFRQAAGG